MAELRARPAIIAITVIGIAARIVTTGWRWWG